MTADQRVTSYTTLTDAARQQQTPQMRGFLGDLLSSAYGI
jgi:hypothetical protein